MSLTQDRIYYILGNIMQISNFNRIEAFVNENKSVIEEQKEEHSDYALVSTQVYEDFIQLIEDMMDNELQSDDITKEEFYHSCRCMLDEQKEEDEIVRSFVTIINLTTDFQLFVSVMTSEPHRMWFFQMLRAYANTESKGK